MLPDAHWRHTTPLSSLLEERATAGAGRTRATRDADEIAITHILRINDRAAGERPRHTGVVASLGGLPQLHIHIARSRGAERREAGRGKPIQCSYVMFVTVGIFTKTLYKLKAGYEGIFAIVTYRE